jgi:DNA-binding MarR family transcriptional regulator
VTRRAARALSRRYDQAFADLRLTTNQFALLAAVATGPLAIGDLESMMVMEASTLSRNLSVLRRGGWLVLEGHGGRRAGRLTLTADGQDLLAAALPRWQRVQAEVTARLGTGRASLLLQGLNATVAV